MQFHRSLLKSPAVFWTAYLFVSLVVTWIQYSVGFGSWAMEYAGGTFKNFADPSGAYLASGIQLGMEQEGVFPGHPGFFSKVFVFFSSRMISVFSELPYVDMAFEKYRAIAILSKVLHLQFFLLGSVYLIHKATGEKSLAMVFFLTFFSLPYAWIYADAIAPEPFVMLGYMTFGAGLFKQDLRFLIPGLVLVALSKFMLLVPVLALLLLLPNRKLVITVGAVALTYGVYFLFNSPGAFLFFWFKFSPVVVDQSREALSGNYVTDSAQSLVSMFSMAFNRLSALVLMQNAQPMRGIHVLNCTALLTLGLSAWLMLTELSRKSKVVLALGISCSFVLFLFRNEDHYLLPLTALLMVFFLMRFNDLSKRKKQAVLGGVVLLFALNLPFGIDHIQKNRLQGREDARFYHASLEEKRKRIAGDPKRLDHYYPYVFSYTTLYRSSPFYELLCRELDVEPGRR